MFIFYDFIFFLFMLLYLPGCLIKRKFHKGWLVRLGFLPKKTFFERPIWVHAVSVGEAMTIRALVAELRKAVPQKRFVISTVTPTGQKIARTLACEGDMVTYLPFDFSFVVKRAINRINPCIFIIVETEIWPNLISCLHKKNTPVIVVNTRISDKSFRGYAALKLFFGPLLNQVRLFLCQTDRDADKIARLGVAQQRIIVSGNMKFDSVVYAEPKGVASSLKFLAQEKLFVAGSTHPGEEEGIVSAYKKLSGDFPNLRLLIAPRHPERAKEIGGLVEKSGFSPVFISALGQAPCQAGPAGIFILDTIGELVSFYAMADIVFIGGSLIKKGGHNILEPAFFSKPIIFGRYMYNFQDICDIFIKNQAACMVRDWQELQQVLFKLLSDEEYCLQLGKAAGKLILKNQGATLRNINYIKELVV